MLNFVVPIFAQVRDKCLVVALGLFTPFLILLTSTLQADIRRKSGNFISNALFPKLLNSLFYHEYLRPLPLPIWDSPVLLLMSCFYVIPVGNNWFLLVSEVSGTNCHLSGRGTPSCHTSVKSLYFPFMLFPMSYTGISGLAFPYSSWVIHGEEQTVFHFFVAVRL